MAEIYSSKIAEKSAQGDYWVTYAATGNHDEAMDAYYSARRPVPLFLQRLILIHEERKAKRHRS